MSRIRFAAGDPQDSATKYVSHSFPQLGVDTPIPLGLRWHSSPFLAGFVVIGLNNGTGGRGLGLIGSSGRRVFRCQALNIMVSSPESR